MDTGVVAIIIISILALVVVIGFFVYRKNADMEIKAGDKVGMRFKGTSRDASDRQSAPPSARNPAIDLERVESREGGLVADDSTGGGVRARDVKTKDDILISSKSDPKA